MTEFLRWHREAKKLRSQPTSIQDFSAEIR